jgi:hypothetical protein
MNWIMNRFLKSAFRQEPVASFLLMVGAVDAALGGVQGQVGLSVFGLAVVGAAAGVYWWGHSDPRRLGRSARSPVPIPEAPLALPPRSQSHRDRLPTLTIPRKARSDYDDYRD